MNALDIIILLIAAAGAFFGWRSGFIAQIGKAAGLVLGVIACRLCGDAVGRFAQGRCDPADSFPHEALWTIAAYLMIFLTVYIVTVLVASALRKVAHSLHTSLLDRLAGAAFRVLEYMFFLSLIFNFWLVLWPDSRLRTDPLAAWHPSFCSTCLITLAPDVMGSGAARQLLGTVDCLTNHKQAGSVDN